MKNNPKKMIQSIPAMGYLYPKGSATRQVLSQASLNSTSAVTDMQGLKALNQSLKRK